MGVGGVYLFVCVYFRVACTTRLIYLSICVGCFLFCFAPRRLPLLLVCVSAGRGEDAYRLLYWSTIARSRQEHSTACRVKAPVSLSGPHAADVGAYAAVRVLRAWRSRVVGSCAASQRGRMQRCV